MSFIAFDDSLSDQKCGVVYTFQGLTARMETIQSFAACPHSLPHGQHPIGWQCGLQLKSLKHQHGRCRFDTACSPPHPSFHQQG